MKNGARESGDLIDEAQAGVLAINRPDSTGVETIQPIKKVCSRQ
jgi:hypothetical protein